MPNSPAASITRRTFGAFGLATGAILAGCGASQGAPAPLFPMRRGVNLGNALEAPAEGEWGYRVELAHLAAIRDAGFDGVRLPVRWDPHMAGAAPYSIDPAFLARVDGIVRAALDLGLTVQLDAHHFEPLIADPDGQSPRFRALWRQIGAHFADAPPGLIFEPLNEPNGEAWSGARVSDIQAIALEEIRARNPTRLVVLGGPNWNSIDGLRDWRPPEDPHITVTVHYYEPHAFTHQDAEWLGADAPRFGRDWGTPTDHAAVRDHIAQAARWAQARGLAWQLGEFGVNASLPMTHRAAWTRAVREATEAAGAGWCAWDFAGAFPIYDRARERFIPELIEALLG